MRALRAWVPGLVLAALLASVCLGETRDKNTRVLLGNIKTVAEGKISVYTPSDDKTVVVGVTKDTQVRLGYTDGTLQSLKPEMMVIVRCAVDAKGRLTAIRISAGIETPGERTSFLTFRRGKVVQIDSATIAIRDDRGDELSFKLPAGVPIRLGASGAVIARLDRPESTFVYSPVVQTPKPGSEGKPGDIKLDDLVCVTFSSLADGTKSLRGIAVLNEADLARVVIGKVARASSDSLTIRENDKHETTFTIGPKTTVNVTYREITAGELRVGELVRVIVPEDQSRGLTAIEVQVCPPRTTGRIKSMTNDGFLMETKEDDGTTKERRVILAEDTRIDIAEPNEEITKAKLIPGATVIVEAREDGDTLNALLVMFEPMFTQGTIRKLALPEIVIETKKHETIRVFTTERTVVKLVDRADRKPPVKTDVSALKVGQEIELAADDTGTGTAVIHWISIPVEADSPKAH